jgi:hypothetical protein
VLCSSFLIWSHAFVGILYSPMHFLLGGPGDSGSLERARRCSRRCFRVASPYARTTGQAVRTSSCVRACAEARNLLQRGGPATPRRAPARNSPCTVPTTRGTSWPSTTSRRNRVHR